MKQNTFSLETLPAFVHNTLYPLLKDYSILVFKGPLGAGKTTLIKELVRMSGVTENVNSPTFAYVKTYKGSGDIIFHHFDLYRIHSLQSFVDSGFEEYLLQPHAVCLIEWPEVIAPLLAQQHFASKTVCISVSYDPRETALRFITIEKNALK